MSLNKFSYHRLIVAEYSEGRGITFVTALLRCRISQKAINFGVTSSDQLTVHSSARSPETLEFVVLECLYS